MAAAATSFESKFLLTDDQIAAMGVPEHLRELYRRHHYKKSFALPTWAPALAAHTFRTVSPQKFHSFAV